MPLLSQPFSGISEKRDAEADFPTGEPSYFSFS